MSFLVTSRQPFCRLQNQFDSIDLTDNAITRLEGFPRLHRLRTLLLSNNRINRISPRLEGELRHSLRAWQSARGLSLRRSLPEQPELPTDVLPVLQSKSPTWSG